jgi:hypothetical protein
LPVEVRHDVEVLVAAEHGPAVLPRHHGDPRVGWNPTFRSSEGVLAHPGHGPGSLEVGVAPRGRLSMVIAFKISGARIVEMDVIADPARLRQLHLVLTDSTAPSPRPASWRR